MFTHRIVRHAGNIFWHGTVKINFRPWRSDLRSTVSLSAFIFSKRFEESSVEFEGWEVAHLVAFLVAHFNLIKFSKNIGISTSE